jgi:hypothetical protein
MDRTEHCHDQQCIRIIAQVQYTYRGATNQCETHHAWNCENESQVVYFTQISSEH